MISDDDIFLKPKSRLDAIPTITDEEAAGFVTGSNDPPGIRPTMSIKSRKGKIVGVEIGVRGEF